VTEEAASFAARIVCDGVCAALRSVCLTVVVAEEAVGFAVSIACDAVCVALPTCCLTVVVAEDAVCFAVSTACDAVWSALRTCCLTVVVAEDAVSFAVSTACAAACVAVPGACPAVFVIAEPTSFAEPAPLLAAAGADEVADVTIEPADGPVVVVRSVEGAEREGAEGCATDGVEAASTFAFVEGVRASTADSTEEAPLAGSMLGAGAALVALLVEAVLDGTGMLVAVPAPAASSDAVG